MTATSTDLERSPGVIVGVDIGGTFTDIVILDRASGALHTWKVLTTPHAPEEGVLRGVNEALRTHDYSPNRVDTLVHATTLVTNALIERKGVPTGLITTRGFKDAIEIGREMRYDLYDLNLRFPEPLIGRDARLEIGARNAADGSQVTAPDRDEVLTALLSLEAQGVTSVAVSLLHAYADPSAEQQVAAWLAEARPNLSVSLSSDVAREIGEYERTSTVAANAYVKPVIDRYLRRLEDGLAEAGFHTPLLVMHSAGGFFAPSVARRYPIRLLESGPAAGALAAAYAGASVGVSDLLGFDMGGTTAKACLVQAGVTETTFKFEAGRVHRFKRGSGLPILTTSVDLIEIGAGGGSVARVDSLGLLQVGPESAGSDPGPACYDLGGTAPTVTDADLVLGYLGAESFLGGRMKLAADKAHEAIKCQLADPLGLTVTEAAWGVHQVVNENMASAARIYLAEKGKDPRRFSMVATGGAGPVHAFGVARSLGLDKVIYPYAAGVGSAVGLLVAPAREDEVQPYVRALNSLAAGELALALRQLEERTRERFEVGVSSSAPRAAAAEEKMGSSAGREAVSVSFSADMRYAGQGQWVNVPLSLAALDAATIAADFQQRYLELFGNNVRNAEHEFVNLRVVISSESDAVRLQHPDLAASSAAATERPIFVPGSGAGSMRLAPVLQRSALPAGSALTGPCIIEEAATTIVVNSVTDLHIDAALNLIVAVPSRALSSKGTRANPDATPRGPGG